MTQRSNLNHFSPVFANKHWTTEKQKQHYACYERAFDGSIKKAPRGKGRAHWGRQRKLYSQALEDHLNKELENEASLLYNKLINAEFLNADERMKWSQFLITQSVRTPSFFSYAEKARELCDDSTPWKDTIVGCIECEQNKYIACRNWIILTAHEDDSFIRTDNPVYLTGFIESDEATLFYPLTPKKCFVACSMPSHIPILKGTEPPFPKLTGIQLEKGDVFSINFELSKSASKSVILKIDDETPAYEALLTQTLGVFPQLPFFLHSVKDIGDELDAMESLLHIMSATDQISYPEREYPFKPFYGVEFEMGLNPFSIFGVTDAVLAER